jgi:hypothetical protein
MRFDKLMSPVRVAVTLVIVWVLAGSPTAVAATLGRGKMCVSLPVDAGPPAVIAKGFSRTLGLVPHSQGLLVGGIEACADHPDALLRLAGVLTSLPLIILFLGAIVLAYKLEGLTRDANGLYAGQSASAIKYFGWYMVVGSAVVAVVESAANAVIVQKLARNVGWAPAELRFPLIPLAAGLLLIAYSRVVREGCRFPISSEIPSDS